MSPLPLWAQQQASGFRGPALNPCFLLPQGGGGGGCGSWRRSLQPSRGPGFRNWGPSAALDLGSLHTLEEDPFPVPSCSLPPPSGPPRTPRTPQTPLETPKGTPPSKASAAAAETLRAGPPPRKQGRPKGSQTSGRGVCFVPHKIYHYPHNVSVWSPKHSDPRKFYRPCSWVPPPLFWPAPAHPHTSRNQSSGPKSLPPHPNSHPGWQTSAKMQRENPVPTIGVYLRSQHAPPGIAKLT